MKEPLGDAEAPIMTIEQSWEVIEAWIKSHYPSMIKLLNGPAAAEGFKRLEERVGQQLPEDFKRSYLIHDGSDDNSGVLIGLSLMSLTEIETVWTSWQKVFDPKFDEYLSADCSSSPVGAVKSLYRNRGWVPFAGDSMNHFAIDFDPDSKGKKGQIINCGRDDRVRHVVAESFTEFMNLAANLFIADQVILTSNVLNETKPLWLSLRNQRDLLTGLPEILDYKKRKR